MHFFTRTCLLLLLSHFASTQRFLFKSASISFKRINEKPVRNRTVEKLTTIDQHLFANAVDIKIRTNKMNLYESAVKNLPNLKYLRLKNCGIRVLEARAFRNLPTIETIHLNDNDLTVIVNGVFNDLPIRKLWLQKNEIMHVESGAFDNMPNLEEIRLNDNLLTKWDGAWFANTPRLTMVFFRKNEIAELPPRAFANLRTSHKVNGLEIVDTEIFLTNNKISHIHPDALHGIYSLHKLCLRKNKLKEIDRKVFSHMTQLDELNLNMNSLSKFERDAFKSLSEMQVLNLTRNDFECIPYDVVSKVTTVVLRKNPNFKCQCIFNLRERLREEGIASEIDVAPLDCDYDRD